MISIKAERLAIKIIRAKLDNPSDNDIFKLYPKNDELRKDVMSAEMQYWRHVEDIKVKKWLKGF